MKKNLLERIYLVLVAIAVIAIIIFVFLLRSVILKDDGTDIINIPWQALVLFCIPTMFPLLWVPYIHRVSKYRALLIGIIILVADVLAAALGVYTSQTAVGLDKELYAGISVEILGALTTASSIVILEQILSKFLSTQSQTRVSDSSEDSQTT